MRLVFPSSPWPSAAPAGRCAARARHLLCGLSLALAVMSACSEPDEIRVRVHVGGLGSCSIGEPLGFSLSAYGDFPGVEQHSWDAAHPSPSFPQDTRAVRALVPGVASSFVGVAASEGPLPTELDIVLLPEAPVACALLEPDGGLPAAPALAARTDGGFVLAGGEVGDLGDARAYVWSPATRRFASLDGLLSRRMRAAAATTPSGAVLVTGGASSLDATAHATAELLAPGAAAFDRDPLVLGQSRCDHAAVALADGSILLLGGRASPTGPAVRTAELLDLATRRSRSDFAPMIVARAGHDAALLDDGTVVIAGGVGADGAPVTLVERFDPSSRTFAAEERVAPEHACAAGWSIAPLVGGRALLVARCPNVPRYVLLRIGGLVQQQDAPRAFAGTFEAAAPRTDGSVLLVGRDADATTPHVELLRQDDWSADAVEDGTEPTERPADERVRLLPIASGDLVEVAWRTAPVADGARVHLRSGAAESVFRTPRGRLLVNPDIRDFALDASFVAGPEGDRWEVSDGIRPVVRGAEAWIVRSRFARFRLEVGHRLEDGAPAEASAVLLGRSPAPLLRSGTPLRVEWTDAVLAVRGDASCFVEAPRPAGTIERRIVVERTGPDALRVGATDLDEAGGELAHVELGPCTGLGLPERAMVGLAPARGHRLRSFAITRVAP